MPLQSIPIDLLLVENCKYSRRAVKNKLIKEKLISNSCSICGLGPIWNGDVLVMVLDHINGVNNDNRLENLRLLCPNCNSQTPTFCARNIRHPRKKCLNERCDNLVKSNQRDFCSCKCANSRCRIRFTKIEWPQPSVLKELVNEFGYCEVGRRLGVTDNAVRKRIINHP